MKISRGLCPRFDVVSIDDGDQKRPSASRAAQVYAEWRRNSRGTTPSDPRPCKATLRDAVNRWWWIRPTRSSTRADDRDSRAMARPRGPARSPPWHRAAPCRRPSGFANLYPVYSPGWDEGGLHAAPRGPTISVSRRCSCTISPRAKRRWSARCPDAGGMVSRREEALLREERRAKIPTGPCSLRSVRVRSGDGEGTPRDFRQRRV